MPLQVCDLPSFVSYWFCWCVFRENDRRCWNVCIPWCFYEDRSPVRFLFDFDPSEVNTSLCNVSDGVVFSVNRREFPSTRFRSELFVFLFNLSSSFLSRFLPFQDPRARLSTALFPVAAARTQEERRWSSPSIFHPSSCLVFLGTFFGRFLRFSQCQERIYRTSQPVLLYPLLVTPKQIWTLLIIRKVLSSSSPMRPPHFHQTWPKALRLARKGLLVMLLRTRLVLFSEGHSVHTKFFYRMIGSTVELDRSIRTKSVPRSPPRPV